MVCTGYFSLQALSSSSILKWQYYIFGNCCNPVLLFEGHTQFWRIICLPAVFMYVCMLEIFTLSPIASQFCMTSSTRAAFHHKREIIRLAHNIIWNCWLLSCLPFILIPLSFQLIFDIAISRTVVNNLGIWDLLVLLLFQLNNYLSIGLLTLAHAVEFL